MTRQLTKVVVAQVLEAAKSVMAHLDRPSVEPGELRPRVRRLHDYLQRSLSASVADAELVLALDDQDRNLLAACALHHLGEVELVIAEGRGEPRRNEVRRADLRTAAIALATRPVELLPGGDTEAATEGVRAAIAEIAVVTASAADQPVLTPSRAAEAPMIAPARIGDPRLRAMFAMDARAFEHTSSTGDFRLAMLHLSAMFEAMVVDYALPRQAELGLEGPTEEWRIMAIVERGMGDELTAEDRPVLLQLMGGRHLVRPAIQLQSPMVVTRATLGQAAHFVHRVAVEFGYAGSRDGEEASADAKASAVRDGDA